MVKATDWHYPGWTMSEDRERDPPEREECFPGGRPGTTPKKEDDTSTATEDGSMQSHGRPTWADIATVEQVIRRATKLQLRKAPGPDAQPQRFDDAEILRIGEELGLEPASLRQALLEVRSEQVRPLIPAERGAASRLLGERYVRTGGTVPGPAEEVQRTLETHLYEVECLAKVRGTPGASVWEPATGLATRIQRSLNIGKRAYVLARTQEVLLQAAAVDDEHTLVTLTADLGNLRKERAIAWTAGSAFLLAPASFILLLLLGVPLEISLLGGATGAGAAAISGAKRAMVRQRARVRAALDGILDKLRRGAAP